MEVSVAKNQCIQQLRGLAILLVLFAHLSLPTTLLQMSGFPIVNPGYSGVWLFCIISGYVVVRSFQRSGWDCTRFAIRRVHRLYPSLIAFLGVSGLVVGLASLYPVGSLPRTLLAGAEWDFWVQGATVLAGIFINAIQGHTPLYVNGAIWSLSIEFQFYLSLWVLVSLAVWRGLGDAKIADNVRWLAMIVLGLVAGIRVAMLIGYSPKALFGPFIGGWLFSIVIWRFDFMACGVILALSQNKWMGSWRLRQRSFLIWLSVLVGLTLLAINRHPLAEVTGADFLEGFAAPISAALFTLAIAAAAARPASVAVAPKPWQRLLRFFGERSYTIYLLHFPCFALLWLGLWQMFPQATATPLEYGVVQLIGALALTLLLTEVIYRAVELPGITAGERLLANRRSRVGLDQLVENRMP
jgi:peptidoglycan/LPS O-acetylase OafA/YrhL